MFLALVSTICVQSAGGPNTTFQWIGFAVKLQRMMVGHHNAQ